jgi:hypothetical protein
MPLFHAGAGNTRSNSMRGRISPKVRIRQQTFLSMIGRNRATAFNRGREGGCMLNARPLRFARNSY